jgi:hypothetical protein
MKSTIAVLVAVLGFAATVAWAGDDMPRTPSQQQAPSARVVDIDADARTPRATPAPGSRRAQPAKPAAKQPRAAPVICACLTLDAHA